MGGRTRIYRILIFSSIFLLLIALSISGVVSANANNTDGSSEVSDNIKNAAASAEEIRERLTKTFALLGEWEEYGIPSKTQPARPAEQPEKIGAGVTPEAPPEKPDRTRGYKIILPPAEKGVAPIGRLSLPEDGRMFISAAPVSLPPAGRGAYPSIYGVSPPTKTPTYFSVSPVQASSYVKPTVSISSITVPSTPYKDIRIPKITAASAYGRKYVEKDYQAMISDSTIDGTPAYMFMDDQGTSPVNGYGECKRDWSRYAGVY